MMKKNGFTLAEVLITLAIIGVVATLTLPALMQNTQEQQAKTALKKGINTLTEMAGMNQAVDGFDYASIADPDTSKREASECQSLFALLATRGSVDFSRTGTVETLGTENGYLVQDKETLGTNDTSLATFAVALRDGSIIYYVPGDTVAGHEAVGPNRGKNNEIVEGDGLVRGFTVVLDTNGTKGPNILSNCLGIATGAIDTDGTEETLEGQEPPRPAVCEAKNRVIRDQFMLRLRGNYATPLGAAAEWAYNN